MMSWKSSAELRGHRCVFLDRDGVVNERIVGGYVLDWSDFRWRPDAVAAMRLLEGAGLDLVIVSNQSCVGRGLLEGDALRAIMANMLASLKESGVRLAAWYACPHAPDEGCRCRKPGAEMLFAAERELGVNLKKSFLVGDSESDVEAGRAAGCESFMIDSSVPDSFVATARIIVGRENSVDSV